MKENRGESDKQAGDLRSHANWSRRRRKKRRKRRKNNTNKRKTIDTFWAVEEFERGRLEKLLTESFFSEKRLNDFALTRDMFYLFNMG